MSGTRQGTHERSSLSDVQSKSNEDQKTGTDLRTWRGTVASTGSLFFCWVKSKSSTRTSKKRKTSKDGDVRCLFSRSVSRAEIAPEGNLIFSRLSCPEKQTLLLRRGRGGSVTVLGQSNQQMCVFPTEQHLRRTLSLAHTTLQSKPCNHSNLLIVTNAGAVSGSSHLPLTSSQCKPDVNGRTESRPPPIGDEDTPHVLIPLRTYGNMWGNLLRSSALSCLPNQGQRGSGPSGCGSRVHHRTHAIHTLHPLTLKQFSHTDLDVGRKTEKTHTRTTHELHKGLGQYFSTKLN